MQVQFSVNPLCNHRGVQAVLIVCIVRVVYSMYFQGTHIGGLWQTPPAMSLPGTCTASANRQRRDYRTCLRTLIELCPPSFAFLFSLSLSLSLPSFLSRNGAFQLRFCLFMFTSFQHIDGSMCVHQAFPSLLNMVQRL